MAIGILLVSCVILMCVLAEKFSDKFGMPALILFMFVGMLFGSDGIMKIDFDNFVLAENACSVALIFIMFYGGFNTKWVAAPWCNKTISELKLAENELIVMIIRGGETIIPNGTTVMKANDLVVTYK